MCILLVFGVERVRINVSLSRELVEWLDEQVRRNPGLFHSRSHAVELLLRLAAQHVREFPSLGLREAEALMLNSEFMKPRTSKPRSRWSRELI